MRQSEGGDCCMVSPLLSRVAWKCSETRRCLRSDLLVMQATHHVRNHRPRALGKPCSGSTFYSVRRLVLLADWENKNIHLGTVQSTVIPEALV